MSSYVLGVDIGGSKTHALLTCGDVVVADLRGPSANPASVGTIESARRIRTLLTQLAASGIRLDQVRSACAGAAGVDTPEQVDRLVAVRAETLPYATVRVVHDTELLLAAAGNDSGIALIAGTGSVAWGCAADGRQARAGGWGYVLGDDGSGYGIARAAVRHALARLDAGLGPDPLSRQLTTGCGLDRPELLLDHFYAEPERRYWAEQSATVFRLAEAGEPAAVEIISAAARDLATLVESVSLRLAVAGPVILAGGVLVHQPLLRRLLADRLGAIGITDLRLLDAAPVVGAVRLAREHLVSAA